MIRIFGLVLMSGRDFDDMCELVDRMAKGNWLTKQNNYLRRTIQDLQGKLRYAIFKHPNLEKDLDGLDSPSYTIKTPL